MPGTASEDKSFPRLPRRCSVPAMRNALVVAVFLAGCGGSKPAAPPPAGPPVQVGEPAPPPAKPVVHAPKAPIPLAEYFKIRRAGIGGFNFDDSMIAYTSDEGGRVDVWVKPVAGGPGRQLTHVQGFLGGFEWSPSKDLAVLMADVGGDELMRLYFVDSKGGEPTSIFPDDPKTARSDFVRWSLDGKTFLYASSRRDPQYQDLYEYDLATKKSTLLWQASGKLNVALVSRDLKKFVVAETISDADSNLYLVTRGAKTPALLTQHKGEVLYGPQDFSPDGKTLYFTSDEGGEFQGLYAMDLATKKSTSVATPKWDVDFAGFSRGGKYFFTGTNVDGFPEIEITDVKTKKPVELPPMSSKGTLVPAAFSKTDRYLGAGLTTETAPPSLWVVDLKDSKISLVYQTITDAFRGHDFAPARTVRIKSFDDREVPAFLYSPPGKGPFPATLEIHGGPTGQSRRSFNKYAQYLVSKGYVVLVPNVRGSTGYGKSYTKLDNKDLGGGPLKDVIACKRWLVDNAHVDGNRVVIMGGSYGGYMTLAAATFAPTEFAAHIDLFGVSDLKSLVESFPAYWASAATYIYQKFGNPNDPADAKYQHDRSPLNFLDKIQRPLLVIQGTNDARVKKDQSDRVVEALRKRGVPVDYLVIEGEGHGFSKTENEELALETADRFLDKHIFGDTEVTVLK
jgi:dipeptidyl aminopeptidase/acylaminoacyl peptidase